MSREEEGQLNLEMATVKMTRVAHPRGGFVWLCPTHFEYVWRIDIQLGVEPGDRYKPVKPARDEDHECAACLGAKRSQATV